VHVDEDLGDGDGMDDVGLTTLAGLAYVLVSGEFKGGTEIGNVFFRAVGGEGFLQMGITMFNLVEIVIGRHRRGHTNIAGTEFRFHGFKTKEGDPESIISPSMRIGQ
jgi:hypothetical protein